MLCYRDMTFCTHYEDCVKRTTCPRPLTPEVREAAERWMPNPPICVWAEKPSCHEQEPPAA